MNPLQILGYVVNKKDSLTGALSLLKPHLLSNTNAMLIIGITVFGLINEGECEILFLK
jgi:hypothetical protein